MTVTKFTKLYLMSLRPWFWWAAVAPGICGYVWVSPDVVLTDVLALVFVLGFGLAGFAEMANELYDAQYDTVQRQFSVFGINSSGNTKVLEIDYRFAQWSKTLLFIHLVVTAVISVAVFDVPVVLLIIGSGLGWAYSARPLRLKACALTNIVAKVIGYGCIAFFIGVNLGGGEFNFGGLALGCAIGLVQCGFNGIADINDRTADKENGIFTLPVIVGPTVAASIYMTFCGIGLGALLYNNVLERTATSSMTIIITISLVVLCASIAVGVLRSTCKKNSTRLSQLHLLSGVTMMTSAIWLLG